MVVLASSSPQKYVEYISQSAPSESLENPSSRSRNLSVRQNSPAVSIIIVIPFSSALLILVDIQSRKISTAPSQLHLARTRINGICIFVATVKQRSYSAFASFAVCASDGSHTISIHGILNFISYNFLSVAAVAYPENTLSFSVNISPAVLCNSMPEKRISLAMLQKSSNVRPCQPLVENESFIIVLPPHILSCLRR